MKDIRPSYTDNVTVIKTRLFNNGANATDGSVSSYDLDLRTKYGATLFVQLGRSPMTDTDYGLKIRVFPLFDLGSGIFLQHPYGKLLEANPFFSKQLTISSATAGLKVIGVSGTPNSAFQVGTYVYLTNGVNSTQDEVCKISKVATSQINVDAPLQYSRSGGLAYSSADVFAPLALEGGMVHRVIADFGAPQLGSGIAYANVMAQIYEGDLVT